MKGTVSIELATLEDIISEVGTENILEYMDIDEIVDFINKNQ